MFKAGRNKSKTEHVCVCPCWNKWSTHTHTHTHTHFILFTLFKQQPLQNNNAYLSSSLVIRCGSSGKSECRSFVEKVQRAVRVLVYTVNVVGYRLSWGKVNVCVHLWTDVLWMSTDGLWITEKSGNSAIRQKNLRPLQCTFCTLSSEDVISERRWLRPKQFSQVFLYTTREAE